MTEKERDIASRYFRYFCAGRILDDKAHYSLFSFLLGLIPFYYMYEYSAAGISLLDGNWRYIGYCVMFILCFVVFLYSGIQYLYYSIVFSRNKLLSSLEKREVTIKSLNTISPNFRVIVTDPSGFVESADIANEFSSLFASNDSKLNGYVFTYKYKEKVYRIAYPRQEFECALKYI